MVGISREATCENLLLQLICTSYSSTSGLESFSGIGFRNGRDYLQQMFSLSHPITSQSTLKFARRCCGPFLLMLLASYLKCHGSSPRFCPRSFPSWPQDLVESILFMQSSAWKWGGGSNAPGINFREWGTRVRTKASASPSLGGEGGSQSWVSSGT